MTEARKTPLFFQNADRAGHLYDILTTHVVFSPASFEEMEALDAQIWRLLCPYEVVRKCRKE